MPNVWLEKTKGDGIRSYCTHNECEENPLYFFKTSKKGWRKKIKTGVTVGVIQIGNGTEVYCPDCIDKVYLELKKVFDRKLWVLL